MAEVGQESTTGQESNQQKRVILEIGAGTNPHFNKRADLDSNTICVGIDDRMSAIFTKSNLRRANANGIGMEGDANQLPFRNASCDEVVVANVFGISGEALQKQGYLIDYEESVPIISEIQRVIKPDGACVVLESTTPPKKEKIIKKFKEQGLLLLLDTSDPEILDTYSNPLLRPKDTASYLLKFGKAPASAKIVTHG